MEEAKFSLNIKYQYQSFECQFTMRADKSSASEQLDLGQKAVLWLLAHGAVPNGNGQLRMKEAHKEKWLEETMDERTKGGTEWK